MARKTKAQAASTSTATKSSTKRQTSPPATTTLAKRPKRQSTSKAAPTKSDYFSHESSESEGKDEGSTVESPGVESSELDSLPEDEELEVESSISDEEEDFDEKPKRSRSSAPAKKIRTKTSSKGNGKPAPSTKSELWRPGVTTGLEAGTQVVIKKPKARDAGKTPYTDDTIHPNTLLFLGDLAANNDRGWLKSESLLVHRYDNCNSLQATTSHKERPIYQIALIAMYMKSAYIDLGSAAVSAQQSFFHATSIPVHYFHEDDAPVLSTNSPQCMIQITAPARKTSIHFLKS